MDLSIIKKNLLTQTLGKDLFFKESVSSTQDWAKETLGQAPIGSLFITNYQIKGRGREQKKWESDSGKNILMSFTDKLPADFAKVPEISLVVGLSTLKALLSFLSNKSTLVQTHFNLKWPNDIFCNRKKISGILGEATNNAVIIGIGINVNEANDEFSDEIRNQTISLKDITGKNTPREGLIASLLNSYEIERKKYDTEGVEPILKEWDTYAFSH